MQDTGNVFKIKTHRKNIIKKNLQIINAGEDVEKREHSCNVGKNIYKLIQPQWKKVCEFLRKVSYDSEIPLPGIYPAAAAAAKSLQSCLTLCDPIDGSTRDGECAIVISPKTDMVKETSRTTLFGVEPVRS